MGRIELAQAAGVVKGKTFMVPGSERDVLTARLLCRQHQGIRIKVLRREGIEQPAVLRRIHLSYIPYPLALP